MFAGVGVGEEGFEDLFGGEAYLAGDGDGGEVFGIDLVDADFVGDAEGVEEAGGVGLGGWGALQRAASGADSDARIWPLRMVRVLSAMGAARAAWWVVRRM